MHRHRLNLKRQLPVRRLDRMKKIFLSIMVLLVGTLVLLTGALLYYQNKMNTFGSYPDTMEEYDHHYLFVASDRSEMMQDIFEAACLAAKEGGGYLEWCGSGTPDSYTEAEYIDISIAMDADGIIVCPDGSDGIEEAVGRAHDAGIPAVTILRDLPDSKRISYAGVSGYQTGEIYGGRLISLLHDGWNDVCLLEDSEAGKDEAQILYSQIVQAVKNGAPSGKTLHLRTEEVDSNTDFDTEEVVRNLLLGTHIPDILICESPVQTECAIQTLIDYNLVGHLQVIGYYATDTILRALEQELIPVTMIVDTVQLGKDCTEALDEYRELGRTSSYYNVALDSITPKTAADYIAGHSAGEKQGEDLS